MLTLSAGLLVGWAFWLVLPHGSRRRLPRQAAPSRPSNSANQRVVVILVGALTVILVPGWWGPPAGVLTSWLAWRVLQKRLDDQLDVAALDRQSAEVAELLAACLASGAPLERSTDVVARAVGGAAGDLLNHISALIALGSPAQVAWRRYDQIGALGTIAGVVARSLESGAPLADALNTCAADVRDQQRAVVEAKAKSIAVSTVGPLGLCFLPAFLLLTIVPIVASLLSNSSVIGS